MPAFGSSRNLPDSDPPDQPDRLNGGLGTHGTSTLNKCQTPPRHARHGFVGEGAGTGCGPGLDSDCGLDCGSGGPRRAWVGRLKIGASGKPACRAPDSELRQGPRRAGDSGGAGGAGGAGAPQIRDGDGLHSSPSLTPFHPGAASEWIGKVGWNGVDGGEAMFARRPESGLGPWDPPAPRPTRSRSGLTTRPLPLPQSTALSIARTFCGATT